MKCEKQEVIMMSAKCCIEKQLQNLIVEEEEFEKLRADIEIAAVKVAYFENIIRSADSIRKLAESKIIETESRKLDSLSSKLDAQIQSISELIRKAEVKKDEAIISLLNTEVSLIVLENKILHDKITNS
jgi:hypothetical protein